MECVFGYEEMLKISFVSLFEQLSEDFVFCIGGAKIVVNFECFILIFEFFLRSVAIIL